MSSYAEFLESKERIWRGAGSHEGAALPPQLYDWQESIVRWALRKGRAALFADCGLGKSFMQLAWANALGVRTIILAPLCVAEQTVLEGRKIGVNVEYVRDGSEADASLSQIVITNYERLEKFDVSAFDAVVLDESSILKAFDGKTRTRLIETFKNTRYRLCCTATPSPNDIAELANHSEFLGLMTRQEFLATWFVHDDEGWRMKRHGVDAFYRWLASWGMAIRRPSDLGYKDGGFILPPLEITDRIVKCEKPPDGVLFHGLGLKGIGGRLAARRASLEDRVAAVSDLAAQNDEQWILWCGLNTESEALEKYIPGAVEVRGDDSYEEKVSAVQSFLRGDTRVIVSKAKILGFGMNFQNCRNMAFVGLSDSFEMYYQCIRRCWRFGQTRPVNAVIVLSEDEQTILENVRRKETASNQMAERMLEHVRLYEWEEISA